MSPDRGGEPVGAQHVRGLQNLGRALRSTLTCLGQSFIELVPRAPIDHVLDSHLRYRLPWLDEHRQPNRPPRPLGATDGLSETGEQALWAISAGHGAGRDLEGVADFANGRRCARNFGNALESELTAGGVYVTGEAKTSFKGYYRASATRNVAFLRTFLQFDGEGETANARERAIGGHPAVALKGICLRKNPESPYANADGYVPFGKPVTYTGGRSNGCTSWSPSDAAQIDSLVRDSPTTLYIYPEAADIRAVARAVSAGRSLAREGLYWNASCLREIGSPRYWPRVTLEPLIARYEAAHPAPPPRPTPICTGQ